MQDTRTHMPLIPTDLVIPDLEDDTEDAPWMVMGDAQFWAASTLAHALEVYAQGRQQPWYVASMLPILYRRPGERRVRQVAPDLLVAFVPRRPHESYDLAAEGVFPAFVLEVLSPSSASRDIDAKRRLYEALGAQEYALFAPQSRLLTPPLQGYRRAASGRFEAWRPDAAARLWSEVLGLWLSAEGSMVRALEADGRPLPTPWESEQARQQEAQARQQEAQARQRAEEELARLRALLQQNQDNDDD